MIVKRTVSLIEPKDEEQSNEQPLRLQNFEAESAYILLGEPGMGKTTEFKEEASRIGASPPIPAYQFVTRNPEYTSEWQDSPLFIDGFDEVRVGGGDPREAMNKLINNLETLGKPQFRLSCRTIGWLEPSDRERLSTISDSKDIPVLLLNPLNYEDIRNITRNQNANAFIQQAHEHRMEAFLKNPQLLKVLIKSVENHGWSDSPTKTFKNACRNLIQERNSQHRDARSSNILPCNDVILNEACRLSALMLIVNKIGWSVDDTEDSGMLSMRDVQTENRDALDAAFRSGLFEGGLTRRTPIHRLITEFLGARYLHQKIESGLSFRRVLALIMGNDGVPFPDLRGLVAWLASFNPRIRETLIQTDPVTIALNGDVSSFSLGERRKLLEYLESSNDLTFRWPSDAALGALVGYQGELIIWELTGLPNRSENRQMLVYQLLRGFSQRYSEMAVIETQIPEVQLQTSRKNLLNMVYDPSWKDYIRCEALRAFSVIPVDKSVRKISFNEILSDLQQDLLSDDKNDLRGTILDLMYPSELASSDVWDYLVDGNIAYSHNVYLKFWYDLVNRSQENQIIELLDSLCDRASEVLPKLGNHRMSRIVLDLLARGLNFFGDKLDVTDLYRWFKLVEFDVQTSQLISRGSSIRSGSWSDKANIAIRKWLSEHEIIQRDLIEHYLLSRESKISSNLMIGMKFVGPNPPIGFRLWCLTRSTKLWETHPIVAKRLAEWSVRIVRGWEDPLTDKKIEQIVADIPNMNQWNRKRLKDREHSEQEQAEYSNEIAKIRDIPREKRLKKVEDIRQQKSELTTGNCSPQLLHDLASIYFDGRAMDDRQPKRHLESYLGGDKSLVEAVMSGFKCLLKRDAVPDLDQIAELHQNNKISFFALPFLAAMEEQGDSIMDSLSESEKRKALGFYHLTDRPTVPVIHRGENPDALLTFYENYHPMWYEKALRHYPEAVSDSLIAIHNACVNAKLPLSSYLYEMIDNQAYSQVAQLAVKNMFSAFPTRCTERQLESLRVVLWSAILANAMTTEELRKIVLKRLHRKNMDIAQRAQWLCTGVYVAKEHCLVLLEEFLSTGQESRLRRVLSFLVPYGQKLIFQNIDEWSSEEMSRLIIIIGKRVSRPDFREGAHLLSKEEINSNKFQSLLATFLQEFLKRDDDTTMDALNSLVTNPDLSSWRQEIMRSQQEWNRNRRIANRSDLGLEEVQKSLQGGPPANAADLVSLTTDALYELGDRIRNGQTNDWRQYWNWDHHTNKPTSPKHENDCRDRLLSDLKLILNQKDIDAQPEGVYADEKRSDIRISYLSDFSIPIEIKKNSHRKIWHGINEQLIPKYTRDPNCDGYRIYLVLWFGAKSMSGGIVSDPQELKNQLEKQIDPTLRNKINIVVIDVSQPNEM